MGHKFISIHNANFIPSILQHVAIQVYRDTPDCIHNRKDMTILLWNIGFIQEKLDTATSKEDSAWRTIVKWLFNDLLIFDLCRVKVGKALALGPNANPQLGWPFFTCFSPSKCACHGVAACHCRTPMAQFGNTILAQQLPSKILMMKWPKSGYKWLFFGTKPPKGQCHGLQYGSTMARLYPFNAPFVVKKTVISSANSSLA